MEALSASGSLLKLSNVAKTWPRGDGSARESPNTGAVASRPSGDQKALGVNSVKASSSEMPSSRAMASMFG